MPMAKPMFEKKHVKFNVFQLVHVEGINQSVGTIVTNHNTQMFYLLADVNNTLWQNAHRFDVHRSFHSYIYMISGM